MKLREMVEGLPRPFWVLWSGMLVNRAGSFVIPFMAIYLTQGRGLTPAAAGLVVSLYGAGAMVASPLGGFLADHVGRRVTFVSALVLGGLGMIALGFVRPLAWIAPSVFLVALVGECYRPAVQAAIADLVPPADRGRAFGLMYWVINLGVSIGLSLGGMLATVSFLLLFVGDGLTSIIFGLIAWRLVPETRPAHPAGADAPPRHGAVRGFLAPYRDAPFLAFIVLSVLVLLIFMQHLTAMPLDMVARGVPRTSMGFVLALNGVLIVLVQPFVAPRLARLDRSTVLAGGSALVGLGFGLLALPGGTGIYALSTCLWTLGEIGVLPIANALVADVALPELRGRYQGAYGLSFGVAAFLAPNVGALVLQHFGSRTLWLGCLALGLLVAAGHRLLAPRLRRLRESRIAMGALAP